MSKSNCRTCLKISSDGWSSGYESVNRLLHYLRTDKSASEESRKTHCHSLYRFCRSAKKNPDQLIAMNKEEVEESIRKFADEHVESRKYVNRLVTNLKTFFVKGNKRKDLEFPHYYTPARYRKRPEYVPTLEEALKMSECTGSLRNRAIILILIVTGLRPSTLLALQYGICTDPLLHDYTIKNELDKEIKNIIIVVHDGMKRNVWGACKNRIPYYVFTSERATNALIDYLTKRQRKYGKIADDEPLFPSEYNQLPLHKRRYTFMTTRELQTIIKLAAKMARIKDWKYVTPQSLRKVFESALRNQASAIRLDTKDQEFFMGHILPRSQDAYYDRSKIEEMRTKYSKMSFEPSQVKFDTQLAGEMADFFGINLELILSEANRKLGREPSPSDVRTLLKGKIMRKIKGELKEQCVITEEDLEKHLKDGWEVHSVLNSGKIVVCRSVEDDAPLPNSLEQMGSVSSPERVNISSSDSEEEKPLESNEIPKETPIDDGSFTRGRVGLIEEKDIETRLSEPNKSNNSEEKKRTINGQCNLENFI